MRDCGLLFEDGSGVLLLEDGVDILLLEDCVPAFFPPGGWVAPERRRPSRQDNADTVALVLAVHRRRRRRWVSG